MDAAATTIEREEASRSAPPDWDHVPFDVGCARCGHDLRGLTDPKCPACQLDSDWADAVPIEQLTCETCGYHLYGLTEQRCPECGEGFHWYFVLGRFRRLERPLFEYRWRDRPMRSLIGTWVRTLYPARFWKKMDIHDPIEPLPLGVAWFVSMGIFALSLPVCLAVIRMFRWRWGRPIRWAYVEEFFAQIAWISSSSSARMVAFLGVAWSLSSLMALLLFRQSMRRCKLRTAHVFRACMYSITAPLPVVVSLVFGFAVIEHWEVRTPTSGGAYWLLPVGLCWLHVVWSLYRAYDGYLRMDRSWAVAIASQTIAVLGMFALAQLVNPWFLPRALGPLGRRLGIW